ncbi:uncharacterized protein BDZ99DRAFT_112039 [Mytilinidion resinicola]|uniref:Uncharacterized protein n=1 Tax=Mytilinidion resinicola TaxID=574789 RepID=A0A6A6Y8M8_9PEZI|nr:uncharacterized protein BDZ99DRAFT_112039 [Mytilinidion resinicola]KAF2805050.1 hypothetical protein BDZ99DRAFT_112039 [Mytilinidion resinicola]
MWTILCLGTVEAISITSGERSPHFMETTHGFEECSFLISTLRSKHLRTIDALYWLSNMARKTPLHFWLLQCLVIEIGTLVCCCMKNFIIFSTFRIREKFGILDK